MRLLFLTVQGFDKTMSIDKACFFSIGGMNEKNIADAFTALSECRSGLDRDGTG